MQQKLFDDKVFEAVPEEKFNLLTKEELVEFLKLEQKYRIKFQKEAENLRTRVEELRQTRLFVEERYIILKNKFYGRSSEKSPHLAGAENSEKQPQGVKKKRVLLPSERYPEAALIERRVEFETIPNCSCCGSQMTDSGMTEDSEFLTVVPAEYIVIRQMRQKVRCSKCYGDMKTAPSPPRIKEGSAYSDGIVIDVAMSKYCDLIPIERYAAIAGREGLEDLPPHSLIESTHYLSDFVEGVYEKLRDEILASEVLHADETPHRMLEGDKKKNWYLWGFSTPMTSYYECHNTRSGDVATEILDQSQCQYLVSDVFSGYAKAVRQSNEKRKVEGRALIENVYCNAHARRKFKEAWDSFPEEAQYFIDEYKEIYHLEGAAEGRAEGEILALRMEMASHFKDMKAKAEELMCSYSSKSSIVRAMNYFLENYKGLTRLLKNVLLPIDNNPQERLMRNPVIGRKTWYGTHSKRGAKTSAILFSLVESCKLNGINPREYFTQLVHDIHNGKPPYTPSKFLQPTA